jgi:4-carboxymuconolactone decarboxylase
LDDATSSLVRLAARIAAGSEGEVRLGIADCAAAGVSERWLEELVLQSYLFAGFPRALNAARVWRRESERRAARTGERENETTRPNEFTVPLAAPAIDGSAEGYSDLYDWRMRGEETCARVYGGNYEKLRRNIRSLHRLFDEWMIVEGYGKVLSRAGLDLARRELCIVAACAAAGQDRQLQSHLRGALNAGATAEQVGATIEALEGVVGESGLQRASESMSRASRVRSPGSAAEGREPRLPTSASRLQTLDAGLSTLG